MSQEIQELFSNIAPTYDRLNHLLSFNIDKSWRKKAIQGIKFPTNQALQVLDLCAGTYDLSLALLKRYPQAIIAAADFSHEMLFQGLSKIQKKYSKNVYPVRADALHLPFSDKRFDVVMCAYGFRNLDDPTAGIREMHRVLKPGGQVVLLDFFRPEKKSTRLFHQTYSRLLLPTVGRLVSGDTSAYQYLHDSIGSFLSLSEMEKLFQKEGFHNLSLKHLLMGISSIAVGEKK